MLFYMRTAATRLSCHRDRIRLVLHKKAVVSSVKV